MSGSKEKQKRKAELEGVLPEKIKNKMPLWAKLSMIIASVLVVAILGVIILPNVTSLPQKYLKAAKIGDVSVGVDEYNFIYFSTVAMFKNDYSSYLSAIGLDPEKRLDKQECPFSDKKGATWADYFREQTISGMRITVALADEAAKKGVKLTTEDKSGIESYLASVETAAKQQKLDTGDFLVRNFGRGVTIDTVEKAISRIYLANRYKTTKTESFKFTDDEIANYYATNKDSFDTVSYRSYLVSGAYVPAATPTPKAGATATPTTSATPIPTPTPTAEQTASAMAAAKKKAQAIIDATKKAADFNSAAAKYAGESEQKSFKDENYTLTKDTAKSAITNETLSAWVYNSSRKSGDKTILQTDEGYYAVYFISRARNDYKTVNVRHILAQFKTEDSNTAPTAEQKAAAKKIIDEIYTEWKKTGTEDAFATLATKKTDDTGSASTGGLYESIHKGEMTGAFDDWCFAGNRKVGDNGIVETDYGYHLMYFSGFGKPYWQIQVKDTMVSEAYSKFESDLLTGYVVTQNSLGLNYAEKLP